MPKRTKINQLRYEHYCCMCSERYAPTAAMPYRPWCIPAWPVYKTNIRTYRRGPVHPTCMFIYRPAGMYFGRPVHHTHCQLLYKSSIPTPGTKSIAQMIRLKKIPFGQLEQTLPISTYDFIWICLLLPNK